jgi:putative Holliday junction resolvase
MRRGVRLGIDVGSVRVGVAACDPDGLIATPVATLRRGDGDLDEIARLWSDRAAIEVVVGLPRTLAGREGPAAEAAVAYAEAVAARVGPTPVRLVDERLSTVGAQRGLRSSGVSSRKGRGVVDQAAAVIILQSALDEERATGTAPGRPVQPPGHTGKPDDEKVQG